MQSPKLLMDTNEPISLIVFQVIHCSRMVVWNPYPISFKWPWEQPNQSSWLRQLFAQIHLGSWRIAQLFFQYYNWIDFGHYCLLLRNYRYHGVCKQQAVWAWGFACSWWPRKGALVSDRHSHGNDFNWNMFYTFGIKMNSVSEEVSLFLNCLVILTVESHQVPTCWLKYHQLNYTPWNEDRFSFVDKNQDS